MTYEIWIRYDGSGLPEEPVKQDGKTVAFEDKKRAEGYARYYTKMSIWTYFVKPIGEEPKEGTSKAESPKGSKKERAAKMRESVDSGDVRFAEETPPYQSHASESTDAYHKAVRDGTLDARRRSILYFLETHSGPQSADDYYAWTDTDTTGYGTQFALLRRAGYIRRFGRKKTRSGAMATSYVRGTRVVGADFGDKGHFDQYNVPIRATIREAIESLEVGDTGGALMKLRELLPEEED